MGRRTGRPEKPIDPDNGAIAGFAEEIRRLRSQQDLTVRELAERASCSVGAVSKATSGRTLPTWEVTRAIVMACGEDAEPWRKRWEAAGSEAAIPANMVASDADHHQSPSDRHRDAVTVLPDAPPLVSVTSPGDFHLALSVLRVRAGNPSTQKIVVMARDAGQILARSTLADALRRVDRLPRLELVESLLAAFDVPATDREAWRWAWSRTAFLQQRQSCTAKAHWKDGCPYPGLAAFDEDRADVFYGREQMTARLLKRLAKALDGIGMLAVIGASGAGKSSLLRAGLLPAISRDLLAPGSATWPRLIMTPGTKPLEDLAAHLARATGECADVVLRTLTDDPRNARDIAAAVTEQALARCAEVLQGEAAACRLVLIIDQFEELFTLTADDSAREAFLTALMAMASAGQPRADHPPAVVLVGLRSDFYHCCANYPSLSPVLEHPFLVGPMTQTELRIAITAPASAAGLGIEQGLAEIILGDLRSPGRADGYAPGMLPFLSHALLRTWEHREGTALTARAYATAGGLATGIQASAEDAYASLSPPQRATARALLLGMVGFAEDGTAVRRRLCWEDVDALDDARKILEPFTTIRIVTADRDTAEIAHEALLHGWPRLADWIEEDRERIRLTGKITEDARAWENSKRDNAHLYHGSKLITTQTVLQDTASLSASVHDFLSASDRQEKRRRWRRRLTLGVLVTVSIMATGAGLVAYLQMDRAEHQSSLAKTRQDDAQRELLLYQKSQARFRTLNLQPVPVFLTVDPEALLKGSPTATASVQKQILDQSVLARQHAGLVLAFGGGGADDPDAALEVAEKVNQALTDLGDKGIIFRGTDYRDFLSLKDPADTVELDIYLFKS
jgi:transcriptional regulator with XRE-family HTH domain